MITSKFPNLPKVPLELPEEQDVIDYLTALRRRLIDELTIVRKALERADSTSQVVAEEYEPDEIVGYSLSKKRIESTGYTVASFAPADHHILSATHGDTTASAVVRGDLITGQGASPTWTRLAKGASGTVLSCGADEPAWATTASLLGSGTDNYIPKFGTGATPTFGDSIMSQVGTTQIYIPGSTTNSSLRTGTIEFQSYAVNNAWFGDNVYYDGAFKYRSNGSACMFYFENGGYHVRTGIAGSAGGTISGRRVFEVFPTGGIGIGGGSGQMLVLGYGTNLSSFQYSNYIATRHAGGALDGNAIIFTTGDGNAAGTYGTSIHGLTVENGKIGIGTGTAVTPSYKLHALQTDATTNTVSNLVGIDHQTSGTAANGFGSGILGTLESSTTASQDAAQIAWSWTDATHATRTSKISFSTVTSGGALAELMNLSGTTATIHGDLSLNADATGENRTLTIEGYHTAASHADQLTIKIDTDGRPIMYWGGQLFFHMTETAHGDNYSNYFLGYLAGKLGASSNDNIGIGSYALTAITSSTESTVVGSRSGMKITSGGHNTIFGSNSGSQLTTTADNSLFGWNCGNKLTGAGNCLFGSGSGAAATSANYLTGFGYQVLNKLTTAAEVTAMGYFCLPKLTEGSYTTAFGAQCLTEATTQQANTAFGRGVFYKATATGLAGVGYNVFYEGTTCDGCVGIGYRAGYYPGGVLANQTTTGTYQTFVGYQTGQASTTQRARCSAFGYQAIVDADDAIALGNIDAKVIIGGSIPATKLHTLLTSAVTAAVSNVVTVGHDSSGTAANGFGGGILGQLQSSTTADQDAAQIAWSWTDATHATRTSKLAFLTVLSAGALTERFAITGTEVVVNDPGTDAYDFRVETDDEANMILSDGDANILYLGGTTNGVKIEQGGNLTLIGTATQWEDLRIEPVARTTGGNAPTFEKWYDDAAASSRGVYLYSFDDAVGGSEKEVFFSMQMPHAWAGTAISMHVHWVGAVDDTTADPRWGLEYIWKDIGEVYGDTTIVYSDGTHITTAGADANVTAHKHYLTEFADITPGATADGLSSILIGRLFRDSAAAGDTYNATGAKCGLLYIDAHYEVSSLGSKEEYVK